MPEQCKACLHPEKPLIDKSLLAGMALTALASRFGLSEDSLSRHRGSHLEGEVSFKAQGLDPQELLVDLMANKLAAQEAAQSASSPREKLEALREVRQTTEAIAKLTGAYRQVDQKHLLPFWTKMRTTLLKALAPYPEAREAVLRALEEEMIASAGSV